LRFGLNKGTYDNAIQIPQNDSATPVTLTTSDLFKTFTYSPTVEKTIILPLETTCNIGSWIIINNISTANTITIKNSTNTTTYAILPNATASVGGGGVKMLVASNSASTGGANSGNIWVCSQGIMLNSIYSTKTIDGTTLSTSNSSASTIDIGIASVIYITLTFTSLNRYISNMTGSLIDGRRITVIYLPDSVYASNSINFQESGAVSGGGVFISGSADSTVGIGHGGSVSFVYSSSARNQGGTATGLWIKL